MSSLAPPKTARAKFSGRCAIIRASQDCDSSGFLNRAERSPKGSLNRDPPMPGDVNRCETCGEALPTDVGRGLCRRCTTRATMGGETTGPAQVGNLVDPAKTGGEHFPVVSGTDAESTEGVGTDPLDATAGFSLGGRGGDQDPFDTQDGSGTLARGTTVRYFGDYEVQKPLGQGGMGVVFGSTIGRYWRDPSVRRSGSGSGASGSRRSRGSRRRSCWPSSSALSP